MVPFGWIENGLGRKSRRCEGEGNLGQRRRTRVLHPRTTLQKEFEAGRGAPRETNKVAVKKLRMNGN